MMLLAGPPAVEPGVLGSLIVAGLAVATFFLLRSMAKQLRKIDFDERGDEHGDAEGDPRGDESQRPR